MVHRTLFKASLYKYGLMFGLTDRPAYVHVYVPILQLRLNLHDHLVP